MSWISLLLVLFTSTAFAKERDWLPNYLEKKKIKCELSQEQLRAQITKFLAPFHQQIDQALKEQGVQAQLDPKPEFEIGRFETVANIDFDVKQEVLAYLMSGNTVARGLPAHIRTTVVLDNNQTKVEQALWFPLQVKNPKEKKTCVLQKVTISVDEQETIPAVDLVLGNFVPGKRLVDVVEVEGVEPAAPAVASTPTPTPTPPPAPPPTAAPPQAKAEKETSPEPKKARMAEKEESREEKPSKDRERRRRRAQDRAEERAEERAERAERRKERQRIRRARAEAREAARQQQQQAKGPPERRNECSPDVDKTLATSVTCMFKGN